MWPLGTAQNSRAAPPDEGVKSLPAPSTKNGLLAAHVRLLGRSDGRGDAEGSFGLPPMPRTETVGREVDNEFPATGRSLGRAVSARNSPPGLSTSLVRGATAGSATSTALRFQTSCSSPSSLGM
jgi:hypothetical protein